MKWTMAMLNTLYLEVNHASGTRKGWAEIARVISHKNECNVSASQPVKHFIENVNGTSENERR